MLDKERQKKLDALIKCRDEITSAIRQAERKVSENKEVCSELCEDYYYVLRCSLDQAKEMGNVEAKMQNEIQSLNDLNGRLLGMVP